MPSQRIRPLEKALSEGIRSIYKLVPRANGFEAWRQLLIEYETREKARYAAMMVGITKTRWTGRMSDFPEKMRAWELAVLRYQQATHAIVPDAVRCSIVAMHAPPAVKAYLRLAPTNVLVSYAALREKIFTYVPKPDPAATLKQGLPPVPKARASLLPRARAREKSGKGDKSKGKGKTFFDEACRRCGWANRKEATCRAAMSSEGTELGSASVNTQVESSERLSVRQRLGSAAIDRLQVHASAVLRN